MKRRDFFKTVTGFVAGVFAVFVPKAKVNLNNLKPLPSSVRKRSGTKFITELPQVKAGKWTYAVATYNGKGNSDGIEIYPKCRK